MSDREPALHDGYDPSESSRRQRALEWFLLEGDRRTVALVHVALFGAFFAGLVALGVVPFRDLQAVFYVYSSLVGGNLTLITVVVSINQLLLSRELKTPGQLRSQIEEVIDYRRAVEDAADEVVPVEPLGFLEVLVETTRQEAQRLGGLSRDGYPESFESDVDEAVSELTARMERVRSLLGESTDDTVEVLSVLLESNYAREINRLRRLKAAGDVDLTEATREAIDDVIDRLQQIDVARQYFKSVYLQQELSSLSRMLLYVGLPAVAVALGSLLSLTVPASSPAAVAYPRVFFPVTMTVGTAPLAVLSAYILRTATVTNLTAAMLPFTTPEQER